MADCNKCSLQDNCPGFDFCPHMFKEGERVRLKGFGCDATVLMLLPEYEQAYILFDPDSSELWVDYDKIRHLTPSDRPCEHCQRIKEMSAPRNS